MTPQQANELLRTFAQRIIDMNVQYALDKYGNAKKADTMSCVTLARQALADTANCAPAPTEPAVDRDAVGEQWLDTLRELVSDFRKAAFEFGKGLDPDDHALMIERQGQIFAHAAALATPASPAVPAPRGEFSGVKIDRVHHIMDGYTPKPPPPRPQRPPGPLWTDAERERFRENMKRGERCPICSVIEGGQHFPGCSRGTP